jgi:hypothetical protein
MTVFLVFRFEDVIGVAQDEHTGYNLIRADLNGTTIEVSEEAQRRFNLPDLIKFSNETDDFIRLNHTEYKIKEFTVVL